MDELLRWHWLWSMAALAHRARRVLRRLSGAARDAERRRNEFYDRVWREAAQCVNAEVESVDCGAAVITRGAARIRVRRNEIPIDDAETLAIAGNKSLTYQLLARAGLPVPPHAEFTLSRMHQAVEFMRAVPGPCVVKPARDTGAGRGVTTGIRTSNALRRAATLAASFGPSLLIEQQIVGANYRLLFLDGTLLDAVVRRSPTVVADGFSTVRTLIQQTNELRRAKGASFTQFPLTVDLDLCHTIAAQNLSLDSVPAAGVLVTLKTVVNENRGSENATATPDLCPALVDAGAHAAAAIGARLAGVDLITADPARPLIDTGGVIGEVNTNPGLYYHYCKDDRPTPVAVAILERLLRAADSSHESAWPSSNEPSRYRGARTLDCEMVKH